MFLFSYTPKRSCLVPSKRSVIILDQTIFFDYLYLGEKDTKSKHENNPVKSKQAVNKLHNTLILMD